VAQNYAIFICKVPKKGLMFIYFLLKVNYTFLVTI